MPLKLSWFEREIFINRNQGPGPLLDFFAPLAFKAILAGHKLGIFELLEASGPLARDEVCRRINTDLTGSGILIDALCSIGYLKKKRNARYANSAMTSKWMVGDAGAAMADMLGYFDDALLRWSYLDQSLRNGEPPESANAWLSQHPGSWDRYHQGMRCIARLLAGSIVSSVKLPDTAKRLIDMGGSHGLYSVRFCQKYPGLFATVFDRKEARPLAEKTIGEHHLEKQITFAEGDILTSDLGDRYDVALLFNVIRIFSHHDAEAVLAKAHAALEKNGVILIADQFANSPRSAFARMNAILIVLELFNSGLGIPHSTSTVKAMLAKTGYRSIREIRPPRSPGITIIAAQK